MGRHPLDLSLYQLETPPLRIRGEILLDLCVFAASIYITPAVVGFLCIVMAQSAFRVPTDVDVHLLAIVLVCVELKRVALCRQGEKYSQNGQVLARKTVLLKGSDNMTRLGQCCVVHTSICAQYWWVDVYAEQERSVPYCATTAYVGPMFHQNATIGKLLFDDAGAEARICKKRDAIDEMRSPNLSGTPIR